MTKEEQMSYVLYITGSAIFSQAHTVDNHTQITVELILTVS